MLFIMYIISCFALQADVGEIIGLYSYLTELHKNIPADTYANKFMTFSEEDRAYIIDFLNSEKYKDSFFEDTIQKKKIVPIFKINALSVGLY